MELDQIKIEGLEIFANHGVFPEENVLGQKFIVSATLYTDTRKAGKTDELTASIHYGEVSAFITEFVKSHTYKLLERVAEELVEDMLQKFDGLEKVTLEIQKPWAPVGLPLKTVSVRITRSWHCKQSGKSLRIYYNPTVRCDRPAGFSEWLSENENSLLSEGTP